MALAQAVAAFSQLAAFVDVAEAEINPLLVKTDGVVAVDAERTIRFINPAADDRRWMIATCYPELREDQRRETEIRQSGG